MDPLQEESTRLTKRLEEIAEILHDRKRICETDTHTNMPHYRVIEPNGAFCGRCAKNRRYLIGVKPIRCNVKLDFGGVKIPILDREVSLLVWMDYPMTCHAFDIWMTPINDEEDYSIELKYTDDDDFTSKEIRDVKTRDVLCTVVQTLGMFGVKGLPLA